MPGKSKDVNKSTKTNPKSKPTNPKNKFTNPKSKQSKTKIVKGNSKPIPEFPDLLHCRNTVPLPNTVWVIDGSVVNVSKRDVPGSKMVIVFPLPLCTSKIIFHKTFFSRDGYPFM